jgi:hypothetical protein
MCCNFAVYFCAESSVGGSYFGALPSKPLQVAARPTNLNHFQQRAPHISVGAVMNIITWLKIQGASQGLTVLIIQIDILENSARL